MRSTFLFFVLTVFFCFGCGDNNTNPDNSSNEIFPLAIGNYWSYQEMSYHSNQKDSLKITNTYTTIINKKITVKGEDWFIISGSGSKSGVIFTNRKDGLWGYNFEDSSKINTDSAFLSYKYPTFVNDKNIIKNNGFLTVSLNSKVSTPLGTFNCIRYINFKDQILENNGTFLTPGVGLVKEERIHRIFQADSTSVPDTVWIRTVLINYHINPK